MIKKLALTTLYVDFDNLIFHCFGMCYDEWESNEAVVGIDGGVLGNEGRFEDHGGDDFSRDGFEQVSSTSSAVTDVISNEVGNDGRVTWIVFI